MLQAWQNHARLAAKGELLIQLLSGSHGPGTMGDKSLVSVMDIFTNILPWHNAVQHRIPHTAPSGLYQRRPVSIQLD